MANRSSDHNLYEQTLAERIALVKLVLAVANLLVIWLDRGIPIESDSSSLGFALMVGTVFCAYQGLSWFSVHTRAIPLATYQRLIPFIDVLAVTVLILATDGYLSPFNVWFAITVVSTGFSRSPAVPVLGAIGAMVAQVVIALVPQAQPLDIGVFVVRTFFLLGFAILVALLSNQLVRQSEALAAIDRFGRDVSMAVDELHAISIFQDAVLRHLGADKVRLELSARHAFGPNEVLLTSAEGPIGVCEVYRRKSPTPEEKQFLGLVGDRLSSALKRLALAQELIEAVAREERQRYADELHDTHLQTLAAVDMHVEVAARRSNDPQLQQELREIKEAVREAAQKTRQFIISVEEHPPLGPEAIKDLVHGRWPGAVVHIQEHVELSEGQWGAIRMMVQEGLNNARVHGKSRQIWLSIVQFGPETVVKLDADGRSPVSDARYGYGLRRVETIVNANDGEMVLEAGATGGSCLKASFIRKAQDD